MSVLERADAFVSATETRGSHGDLLTANLVRDLAEALRNARKLVVSAINEAEDSSDWWGGGGRESFLEREDVRACYAVLRKEPG